MEKQKIQITLDELIGQLPPNHKAVVSHEYIKTSAQLRLDEIGRLRDENYQSRRDLDLLMEENNSLRAQLTKEQLPTGPEHTVTRNNGGDVSLQEYLNQLGSDHRFVRELRGIETQSVARSLKIGSLKLEVKILNEEIQSLRSIIGDALEESGNAMAKRSDLQRIIRLNEAVLLGRLSDAEHHVKALEFVSQTRLEQIKSLEDALQEQSNRAASLVADKADLAEQLLEVKSQSLMRHLSHDQDMETAVGENELLEFTISCKNRIIEGLEAERKEWRPWKTEAVHLRDVIHSVLMDPSSICMPVGLWERLHRARKDFDRKRDMPL